MSVSMRRIEQHVVDYLPRTLPGRRLPMVREYRDYTSFYARLGGLVASAGYGLYVHKADQYLSNSCFQTPVLI